MTDNEKLAVFAGLEPAVSIKGVKIENLYCVGNKICGLPNYTDSDADAITLLPMLVERGYIWSMYGGRSPENKCIKIKLYVKPDWELCCDGYGSTISVAITAAVLQLIEREGV